MGNITAVVDPEDFSEEDQFDEASADIAGSDGAKKNTSFSESLSLFQSIQVLANEEDENALKNETASSEIDIEKCATNLKNVFQGCSLMRLTIVSHL